MYFGLASRSAFNPCVLLTWIHLILIIVVGHYLGGRSFGPLVTGATIFASLFSGYTVVGVPNESFQRGFYGKNK